MTFEWPLALLALTALPALVALYVVHECRRGERAAPWAAPALLPNLVTRAPGRLRHVPFALFLGAFALLLVGAARPHATVTRRAEDAAVVLAVDTSRSMAARDVRPTRLDAARAAALRFLDGVPPKYRVAVVAFASRATSVLPPTTDRSLARAALRSLRPGLGTALGDAVDLATKVGRGRRSAVRKPTPTAVLVISDGVNEVGRVSPATAARRARARRIRVSTVVVGTGAGVVRRPLPGGFTEIVRVPSSPGTLRAIAAATGGRFFTSRTDPRLHAVYADLESQLGKRKTKRELTDVFALGSAALLIVGGSLSSLWFRRLP